MMHWTALVLTLLAPQVALANSYHHCGAPLVSAADHNGLPQPEFSFRLTLGDHSYPAQFLGQGHAFDGTTFKHMTWTGTWAYFQHDLQLVGEVSTEGDAKEWRASAVFSDTSVMILNVDRGDGDTLMIRCLPTDGA